MKIGELNLDIKVSNCSSCENLVIEDHSYYLTTPERPSIQIQLPGFNTTWTFDFTPEKTNIFNSYSFGVSPTSCLSELPDGLYTIKYMICPYDQLYQTVYYVRQCKAQCQWDTLLKKSFDSCYDLSPDVNMLLNKIEYLLKGAEIFANDCEPDKAIEIHQKAVELLNRLECILE